MPEQLYKPFDTKYSSKKLTIVGIQDNNGSFNYSFDLSFFTGDIAAVNLPVNAEDVAIVLQPESVTPNTVEAVLNTEPKHTYVNNKFTNTGELSIIMKNHLRDVDFYIDDMGNLVVSGEDAKNYSIDSQGQLVYTNR